MLKVLITDPLNELGLEVLQKGGIEVDYSPGLAKSDILSRIADYDGLLVRSGTQVDPDLIDACSSRMKVIGRAGVGVDNINLDHATKKGIIVVNSPDGNTTAAAEHTIAMMMSLARQIPEADASIKSGEWRRNKFLGVELNDKVLGLIGLGKIGSKVAQVALALGMEVIGYDPLISAERALQMGIKLVELDQVWARSDFISLHVPKIPQTVNLINSETIAKLKNGARIINCARGGLIHEGDLAQAIQSGKVAGAAIDVFEQEPVNPDNPLLKLGNKVIATPHLGASTEEAQINVAVDTAKQIVQVLQEGFARGAVNLPGLRQVNLEEMRSVLELTSKLGSLLSQISEIGRPSQINLRVFGAIAQKETSALLLVALQSFLSQRVEGVTLVNAPLIAKEKGIVAIETKLSQTSDAAGQIALEVETDHGQFQVAGSINNEQNIPMLTSLNHYGFLVPISQTMLLTFHSDRPGVIAKISLLLGNANINISGMALGRKEIRHEAVMLCALDEIPKADLIHGIQGLPEIQRALLLKL
ncbi:MAG: phosphoglycerate dehydrogenase [Candidatus Caenarcaniphilales bacterium]|nr:phosphoglycerate dehydrogenase [Candidatus Caenarcaniphilales bacterium]